VWVALDAAPDASVGEPWSIRAIERPAQYYYNGRPVFTWSGEWDASAAQGMPSWRRLPVLGSPEILNYDDPSLLSSPVISQETVDPEYPAASLRARESGAVSVRFCVDAKGGVHFVSIVRSSGYPRLDDATTRWVARRLVMRPARGNDGPVPVCGFVFTLDWRLPPDPRQAQPPQ
jgi:TonB family protein